MKVQNDKNYLLRIEQDRSNERLKADETARRAREVLLQQIKELQANASKTIAELRAEEQHAVSTLAARTAVEVGALKAEADRVAAQTRAKGGMLFVALYHIRLRANRIAIENSAARVKAEADKTIKQILTGASVQVARNDAEGLRAQAAAEQAAAAKLRLKRENDVDMRKVDAWAQLASNPSLTVATDTGRSVVAEYFASQHVAATLGMLPPAAS